SFNPFVTPASIDAHPLSKKNLIAKPSILQFLADHVKLIPDFKKHLLDIIDLSKSDAQASQAAANVITILAKAGGPISPGAGFGGRISAMRGWRKFGLENCHICTRQVRYHHVAIRQTGKTSLWASTELLSGGRDKIVRVWNCETGSPDFVLEGHTDKISSVAFSPSGMQIASASDDNTMMLWDTHTGAVAFVLTDHTKSVSCISYAPDGRSVASGSLDGTIHGQHIVSGDLGGDLQLWNASIGEPGFKWNGHERKITGVNFSPNGQLVVSSSSDTLVKLWSAQEGALVFVFAGHTEAVTSVEFSPCGSQMATGSQDMTLRLWQVNSAGGEHDFLGQSGSVSSLACFRDARSIIAMSSSGTVRQYDVITGESGRVIPCGIYQAKSMDLSRDGRLIATAGWSNDTRCFGICRRLRRWFRSSLENVDYIGFAGVAGLEFWIPSVRSVGCHFDWYGRLERNQSEAAYAAGCY
ncbi:hypothetical protein BGX29_008075, partial [Mortierella sp. GBA35]